MAIVTKFKNVGPERVGNGVMAASESVDRGSLCAFNSTGTVQEINDTAGFVFAGIAKHAAGSTDEPSVVETDYGTPFFYADATAVQADVGSLIFAGGLGTLATTSTNDVEVGRICDVSVGKGWWIDPLMR